MSKEKIEEKVKENSKQYLFDCMDLIVNNLKMNMKHINDNWKFTQNFIDIINEGIKNKRHFFLLASGRSAMILRCFMTRLVHLGGKSYFISNTMSNPAMTEKDVLIVLSGSGTTSIVASLLKTVVDTVTPHAIVVITSYPHTQIGRMGDLTIKLLGRTKSDQAMQGDEIEAILTPEGTAFEQAAFTYLDAVIAESAILLNKTNKDLLKKHSQGT